MQELVSSLILTSCLELMAVQCSFDNLVCVPCILSDVLSSFIQFVIIRLNIPFMGLKGWCDCPYMYACCIRPCRFVMIQQHSRFLLSMAWLSIITSHLQTERQIALPSACKERQGTRMHLIAANTLSICYAAHQITVQALAQKLSKLGRWSHYRVQARRTPHAFIHGLRESR